MAQIYFSAIVERGKRRGYSVFFPDLPGLASAGRTVQEAARNAEEGLRGHFEMMVEEGFDIPAPRELDAIDHDPEMTEAARILVRADIPSSKAARVKRPLT